MLALFCFDIKDGALQMQCFTLLAVVSSLSVYFLLDQKVAKNQVSPAMLFLPHKAITLQSQAAPQAV